MNEERREGFDGKTIEGGESETKFSISKLELLGNRKEQQDSAMAETFEINGQKFAIAAVADGHEKDGAIISKEATETVLANLRADKTESVEQKEKWINDIFSYIQSSLSEKKLKGGTTFTLAIASKDEVVLGWCGDSESRLVKTDGHLENLTIPHHYGTHKGETERLEKQGVVLYGKRAILKGNHYLAVSRALGDNDFDPFVSHEPEIKKAKISPHDKFLIVASDSFWNVATARGSKRHKLEAALASATNAEDAKNKINDLLGKWEIDDNTTIVVVDLPKQ